MSSSVRAVLSLLPPGAEAATISTFFCGDQVCAGHCCAATRLAHRMSAAPPLFTWTATLMNIVPRLFSDPSWATIASFSGSELIEFIMLAFMSLAILGGAAYGIYLGLRTRRQ
jgi:hypothetical protein